MCDESMKDICPTAISAVLLRLFHLETGKPCEFDTLDLLNWWGKKIVNPDEADDWITSSAIWRSYARHIHALVAVNIPLPTKLLMIWHTEGALESLLDFIEKLQTEQFEEVYEGCRLALWRATKALWPRRKRRPSLYTGRHQFAADAKSAGLAPEVIAALMGYAVTETHQAHYGKRRSGRGHVAVAAEAADIARVVERRAQKSAMLDTQASLNPNRPDGFGF